jgi:hypothetical protein
LSKKPKVLPFAQKPTFHKPNKPPTIDISASLGERELPLTEEELRAAVSRIVLYGSLLETAHSVRDRSYRNVSEDDILVMLESNWTLAATPEWDVDHRNWKYRLKGLDAGGDELVLIVAVQVELDRIDIITKF